VNEKVIAETRALKRTEDSQRLRFIDLSEAIPEDNYEYVIVGSFCYSSMKLVGPR